MTNKTERSMFFFLELEPDLIVFQSLPVDSYLLEQQWETSDIFS